MTDVMFSELVSGHEFTHCSPVTLVPCPALPGGPGSEVGAAHVHDAGGEAQQAAVSVGPVHPGGRRGQAVLLVGADEQVERSVLHVG